MVTPARSTSPARSTRAALSDHADSRSLVRLGLPLSLANFAARGFRVDRPQERGELEAHCRYFLHGFNVVGGAWSDPHAVLQEVPAAERGFAYEGAAMRAAIRALASGGRDRAFARLLYGPGRAYVHLIHVGYGWPLAALRLPLAPVPRTPLLRWLAVDGAGFAEAFFGGLPALHYRAGARPGPRWQLRMSGAGRALWFVASADVAQVAAVVAGTPVAARGQLWSGVGLASTYAGCAGAAEHRRLVYLAGRHAPHYLQGVLFAAAARSRSGVVPAHTDAAVRELFGVSTTEAAAWTDEAAADLGARTDIAAFAQWRARLRALAAERALVPVETVRSRS